ncbi:hypothetical protein P167DRAFT_508972 [Morchella conica CCBAS932]|uniref:Uncharacterized protein n=1 Tax=Morchella conica CCBAS932 TaxID=1392247 RepID=A0A3N4KB72_9PEZI|nr:hypothetical protein P167DRAFT_514433 [Morchella conica CCBAS932]RPB10757.1 hypothetical protein P167DRAFT_508972 [Morchella conica CCBAS932]
MSAATAPAAGDIIRIPAHTAECEKDNRRIAWKQTMMERSEMYYTVHATNISKNNTDVILFVQGNWYNSGANGSYEIKLDAKFQYGQKNKEGENRFLVYHNKANKPYQHRFMATLIQGQVAEWAKKLIPVAQAQDGLALMTSIFGDYLHTY